MFLVEASPKLESFPGLLLCLLLLVSRGVGFHQHNKRSNLLNNEHGMWHFPPEREIRGKVPRLPILCNIRPDYHWLRTVDEFAPFAFLSHRGLTPTFDKKGGRIILPHRNDDFV